MSKKILMRHYIGRRLAEYYAQPSDRVVGSAMKRNRPSFDASFKTPAVQYPFWGQWHWNMHYKVLFRQQSGQWLTPVELFSPHYSEIVAKFIITEMNRWRHLKSFDVVEFGGGRGTNAIVILLFLQKHFPQYFSKLGTYYIMESSASLLEFQKQQLVSLNRHELIDKVEFLHMDIAQAAESPESPFIPSSDVPTCTIGLEILDNLPHDLIHPQQMLQAHVDTTLDSPNIAWEPIQDSLIQYTLEMAPEYYPAQNTGVQYKRWIPTTAAAIIKRLLSHRPNTSLLFADFDWLPPPNITAASMKGQLGHSQVHDSICLGEPLITDMNGIDHECLFSAPSHCDILFPTNFATLATLLQRQIQTENSCHIKSTVRVMKQSSFLLEYGPEIINPTRNSWTGYSPLLEEFGNCSVLIRSMSP